MFKLSTRSIIRSAGPTALRTRLLSPSIIRFNSTNAGLTKEDVLSRSVQVLKGFDLKSQSITMDSKFIQDLGMDSLDYNDALVAIEEEFDVVFDDKTANEIRNVGQCVDYVLKNALPPQQSINQELR